MADIATENYKKSVSSAVERFGGKLEKIVKQLAPIKEELDQLQALKASNIPDWLADAVKKKVAELRKKVDDLRKDMDKAGLELRADLMLLEPPKNADPKEAKKLPSWLEEIIKKKGLPLGKDVSVVPDVDFDLKSMRLKKFGLSFTIDLP